MDILFELEEHEKKWWKDTTRSLRDKLVLKPREYVKRSLEMNEADLHYLKSNLNGALYTIRETAWEEYLVDESKFHTEVITKLVEERDFPARILDNLTETHLGDHLELTPQDLKDKLKILVGDFSGSIMPYLYDLSLSTTNSRRSRAGNTFEALIEKFLELYGYPYEDQSSLGKSFYDDNNLGKMVDVIVPSKEAYLKNRGQCLILTMKTTLRERWQEVVEEINRTNIPQIHLLTLDDGITSNLMEQLKSYNIIIVTYDQIKNDGLKDFKNVIGFEEFFNHEIPHQLEYWERRK